MSTEDRITLEMIFEKLGCDPYDRADRIRKAEEERIRFESFGTLTPRPR